MPPLSRVSEERRCLQKFLDDGKKHILRFENGKFSFKTGPGVVLFETYGSLLNLRQTHHPYLLTDEDRKDVVRTDQTTSKRPRSDNDAVTKEQQVSQVKLVVTACLPLSLVEHPAFRQYNKDHDIQTTLSRRTTTRITQELQDKEVVIPRSAIKKKYLNSRL